MIILTSFNDHDLEDYPDHKVYSISDKQPYDLNLSNVKYDRMNVFIPSSNLLGLTREVFSERYLGELENKQDDIKKVVRDLFFSSTDSGVFLCCWCNENFQKEKSWFCHRVIIKKFMDKYFPYIDVEMRGA